MTVYLDLIILENFLMNYLILYTTGKIMCRKLHIWKIAISSMIGVLYTFSLYINLPRMIVNLSKVLVALILVKISFGSKKIKSLMRETALFLLISFVYAGCSLAFVYFCNPKVVYIVNGVIIGGKLIFEVVIFSAIFSFLLIKMCAKIIKLKRYLTKKSMINDLTIFNKNNSTQMKALIDSGNLLCDPISKDPVIIVEYEKVKNIFLKDELENIEQIMKNSVSGEKIANAGCRIIPYSSLGKSDGLIVIHRVDKVEISFNDEVKTVENVLLGFSEESLSKNGQYSALIGLKVIERGNYDDESSANVTSKSECGVC